MSLRRLIVEIDLEGLNVSEFCRAHGISRWFFYDLRRRVQADATAIEPRSRAPHTVANRTPADVEDAIVAARKALTDIGFDNGPASIAFYLARRGQPAPSESTIWRILKQRGFIEADPSKRPKRSGHRFVAERANECWQIDSTPWFLADDTDVAIINIIDDCSRVCAASTAARTCTGTASLDTFANGAAEWGLPERILSDNAKAFREVLAAAVAALGIASVHSRPHHPQTCGKVERFHQTLKRFLAAQPPAADLAALQDQLDFFRHIYNHERPHRGVNRQIPASIWHTTPKSGPRNRPLSAETHIHHCRATNRGVVAAGRNVLINLGARYAHQQALIVITATTAHVFVAGRLARTLTIDPSKRYQPLNPPT